jgi:hypothetical protein
MTNTQTIPPRWAEAVLQSLLRSADRESISGDLLEEYRAAKRPSIGPLRANAWYIKHVVSMLWHLIRPYALVLAAQGVLLAVTVFRPGHHAPNFQPELRHTFMTMAAVRGVLYGSVLPTPGVSLFDALIYFAAAYQGVQRTRLIRTGLLAAGATSLVGFATLFAAATVITPSLALGALVAVFEEPFIFVILSVYLLVPVAYALLVGALAGVIGKRPAPFAPRKLGAP